MVTNGTVSDSDGKSNRSRSQLPRTGARSSSVSFTLDTHTEDVPELHHAAAESVSDLFLETDETDETAEPPIDLP